MPVPGGCLISTPALPPHSRATPQAGTGEAHASRQPSRGRAPCNSCAAGPGPHPVVEQQVGVLEVAVQDLLLLQQRQPVEELLQDALELRTPREGRGWGFKTCRRNAPPGGPLGRGQARRCYAHITPAEEQRQPGCWAGARRPQEPTCGMVKWRPVRLARCSRPVMSWSM